MVLVVVVVVVVLVGVCLVLVLCIWGVCWKRREEGSRESRLSIYFAFVLDVAREDHVLAAARELRCDWRVITTKAPKL